MKNNETYGNKDNNILNINHIKDTCNSCFFSLPPKQFAILASLIGVLLIDGLDANQQNSLGNFIVSIGQSILTAAAQEQVIESNDEKSQHLRKQIDLLKKQINELELQLD
ncbi:hypothetical protein CIW83_17570 [Tissierella sp. P1]|uniref:hypothetical protein n=1 Tax=Tissierella sp. P1 TaxID=1280483 RepID=UPI000BA14073|nr:hypothetical protein [Tissierella sp. P1]OZV10888.1 hypothetical protein CIW83_17570 [Tissierella sp. P1]